VKLKRVFRLQTLYEFKKVVFSRIGVDDWCKFLKEKTFIRPNHITVFNWVVGLLALYVVFESYWLFVVMMVIHFLLDNLDGYYARNRGMETNLGDFLDHAGDVVFGVLFMIKSYLVMGEWWILLAIVCFLVEVVVLYKMKLLKDKFPSRVFLIFFLFGLYRWGLLFQVVYQPFSLLLFIVISKMKSK
jgi:phosphatidylglycerophosphate synthase